MDPKQKKTMSILSVLVALILKETERNDISLREAHDVQNKIESHSISKLREAIPIFFCEDFLRLDGSRNRRKCKASLSVMSGECVSMRLYISCL